MNNKLVYDFNDFLIWKTQEYCNYHTQMIHEGNQVKILDEEEYTNKYFFYLVDKFRDFKKLVH